MGEDFGMLKILQMLSMMIFITSLALGIQLLQVQIKDSVVVINAPNLPFVLSQGYGFAAIDFTQQTLLFSLSGAMKKQDTQSAKL